MDEKQIWEMIRKALTAFGSCYQSPMDAAARELGVESHLRHMLLAASTFKPDPISVERLRIRSPYSSPASYERSILTLYEMGFFIESPNAGYSLTSTGEEAFRAIVIAAYQAMEAVSLLTRSEMRSLTHSLGRLVQVCMIHGEPISRWSIIYSRRLDKAPPEAYSAKIDQYLSDLTAFRDDAHLASWMVHNIGGHAWDILTAVWRQGPLTIGQVSDQLARRGWSMDETKKSLEELRDREWIDGIENLSISKLGKQIRDESEVLTNNYFFSPWSAATDLDLETISKLLPTLTELLLSA